MALCGIGPSRPSSDALPPRRMLPSPARGLKAMSDFAVCKSVSVGHHGRADELIFEAMVSDSESPLYSSTVVLRQLTSSQAQRRGRRALEVLKKLVRRQLMYHSYAMQVHGYVSPLSDKECGSFTLVHGYHGSYSLRHWFQLSDWLPTLEATLALDEEQVRRVGDDSLGGLAVTRQLRLIRIVQLIRIVMRDLLIGVNYLHSHGLAHTELRLETIHISPVDKHVKESARRGKSVGQSNFGGGPFYTTIVEKMANDDGKHDDKKRKAKDDDKKDKALWNDRLIELFMKICVQEVRAGNRPTTHFNKKGWSNLEETFNRAAKRDFGMKQFKNKWDSLKKDWQTWKRMIGKETGLGWDANKKTVDASDDWWDRKLKEIPTAAKFRDKGLLFVDDMDYIFGDVVATGQDAWAPSSGILPDLGGTTRHGIGHDAIDLEGSGDNDDMLRDVEVVNNIHLGGSSRGIPIGTSTDTQVGEARFKGKEKRKGDSTIGSGNWKKKPSPAHKVSDQLEKLVEVMENHDTHTREREDMYGCKTSMNIIYSLPGMEEDSMFFYDCVDLMLKKTNRMMLVSLERPEVQLRWLKRMVAKNASNRTPNNEDN